MSVTVSCKKEFAR